MSDWKAWWSAVELSAWIALAGAAGTLARFGVSGLVQRWFGERFPWGTLAVNLAGCFLFGLVWALAEDRMILGARTRIVVLVGFMGAFTTFSTFAFETSEFVRESLWWKAAGNVVAQNLAGVLCILAGLAIGRRF